MTPQRACYKIYHKALQSGELVRKPCEVCGALKSQGHHASYDRPLDVKWFCRMHHLAEHKRLGWGFKNPPKSKKGKFQPAQSAEWRAKIGAAHKGTDYVRENGKYGCHIRWHTSRGIISVSCIHCEAPEW